MARKFAVLGSPIEHTKSPAIHSVAYQHLGLDWDYTRFEVKSGGLENFLAHTDFDGFSVTMPLKQEAFQLATETDHLSKLAAASNTLLRAGDGWLGFNTDVFGMSKAIDSLPLQNVLVLGSGATAKNALIALSTLNPGAEVSLLARNSQALAELTRFGESLELRMSSGSTPVEISGFETTISTLPPDASLDHLLAGTPNGTLFDVAYNPWPSRLATRWLSQGGNVISGLEMLVWQAIAQIRIFSNGNVAEHLPNEEELAGIMRQAAL